MARLVARGAGQVLRHGPQGAATAHAAVPGLDGARQLRGQPEEEEEEAGQEQ